MANEKQMDERTTDNIFPENCTQDCSTCASACDVGEQAGPSFFDRMESFSKHVEDMGEDNFINMLNEAVAELEAEEAAEEAEKNE